MRNPCCFKRLSASITLVSFVLLLSYPVHSFLPSIQAQNAAKVSPPANIKVLILPGFGNDSSDYLLPQAPQGSLLQSLKNRGWEDIEILPVQRSDWLNVFLRGALDWQFWTGVAPATRPAFSWYLQRIADAMPDDDRRVLLVCHSAGGWLARAALGYMRDSIDPATKVCGIVTLGAPHVPPPPGVMDMTRGALPLTDEAFPGAYYQNDNVFYITVAGDAIVGEEQKRSSFLEPTSVKGFAYNSYLGVCGDGIASGDGVVPVSHAHLDGATQLTLPGIFHSINAPDQWYGSETKIDLWHDELLRQLERATESTMSFPMLLRNKILSL